MKIACFKYLIGKIDPDEVLTIQISPFHLLSIQFLLCIDNCAYK